MKLAGLAPRSAQGWSLADAAHLARRAGLGASALELEASQRLGLAGSLDQLFEPTGHDSALEQGIDHLVSAGSTETLQAWWAALLLDGRAALQERVTLMWHDHFATSNDKVDDVRLMLRQNRLLRSHGFGDFRVLLHEVARDPAMLLWLDGNMNQRGHPNENFAREVMELFALGIGNYDEHDIQEAARAFTGWGTRGRSFHYRPETHDGGTKRLLGESGEFGGDDVVDLILAQPACSRHIARRILAEFVSEAPLEQHVAELAGFLVANEWNIGATLRHVLESELFHATESRRNRIVGPVEFVVASCRQLEFSPTPSEAAQAFASMGQALFRPPSVKGWDGGRSWINAGTWLARHNFGIELASRFDAQALDEGLGRPTTRDLAEALLAHWFPGGWTEAYATVVRKTIRHSKSREEALRLATGLILTSPEHHLA